MSTWISTDYKWRLRLRAVVVNSSYFDNLAIGPVHLFTPEHAEAVFNKAIRPLMPGDAMLVRIGLVEYEDRVIFYVASNLFEAVPEGSEVPRFDVNMNPNCVMVSLWDRRA